MNCKYNYYDKYKYLKIKKKIKKIISSDNYNKYFRHVHLVYKGKKLLDKSKIYHYAYVSFITGENYIYLINGTIYSVHFFSIYPIILYVSGVITNRMKEVFSLYERLIVYSIPPEKIHAFFMKLRVSLLAPVLVGQIVEADTIILSGADCLFKRIEKEINRKYPLPMMPRHPNIIGGVSPSEYPMNKRSMRYMHAHMSWRYYALPFIAEVYNKSFIYPYGSDEYALNVNLWDRKANKQWCTYDPYYAVVDTSKNNDIFYKIHIILTFFYFIHGCKSHIIQQQVINKLKLLKHRNYKSIYVLNQTIYYSEKCEINNLIKYEINKENCLI